MDGKSARGSRHAEIPAAHLLAAITGAGLTVTQLRVPDKTNEITCSGCPLLAPYDLSGVMVTADALHCQRDHARFLVDEKKAHYAFTARRTCTANSPPCPGRRRARSSTTAPTHTAAWRPASCRP
ncbi:hypothetical protein OG883_39960 [Streptomyces sp. NBC_01142]|uniref:hypothetical protein n=1 Tax=Streptomyces sp. NBC_01142 TaxID=2975865 RepID=UPI00225206D3|nr:hypothetical protein [Streptomyces sp. NBC_01142]MCX4825881.1 hypothetical protein [Streptomyces sp. NBC_01142]